MIRATRLNQKGKRYYAFRYDERERAGLVRLFKMAATQMASRAHEVFVPARLPLRDNYIHKTTRVTNEFGTLTIIFTPSEHAKKE